jgi:transcriptional regulator with XRE-family HTH domain
MQPIDWLNKAKEKLNIESDYRLAKIIGIGNTAISNIRKRNKGMDNYTACRIADILEIPEIKVISDIEMQKEKNEEKIKYWEKKEAMFL